MVSLMLQFAFYYFLNIQVEKVMAPSIEPVVVKNLEAEIPGTELEDLKLSYAKDYLAYRENGVLKVFNLEQNKVVFEKKPQEGSEKGMGVLYYQWLPDRDTLVYFYARKNPNAVTTVVVPVAPSPAPSTTPSTAPTNSQQSSNSKEIKIQSTPTPTQGTGNFEDPNQNQPQKPENQKPTTTQPENQKPATTQPQTRIEKRYNNPQITELFTLELPPSDEEEVLPDDRYNLSIDSFPAGGEIKEMVVSTFTNLMYLTIQNGAKVQLMEIDIMKDVRTLNKSGEVLSQMAASDKFGTLYVKSTDGKSSQIIALEGWQREVISKDPEDVILGNRSGKIYLGKVEAGRLVNIRKASETSEDKDLDFEIIWEGSIPYENPNGVIIGEKEEIIVYDNQTAFIILNGEKKEIRLPGEENIISLDGVELIQLNREVTSTQIKLLPLDSLT